MKNEVLQAITSRRSHRAYLADQLSVEQLDTLVTAALLSPSANNHQPWHFSVVQDQALLDRVHQEAARTALSKDPSQRSPRFSNPDFQVFYHAPTVIFISAPIEQTYALIDCGIAVQNIALAAESIGLGSVILGLPREAFSGSAKADLEKALQFPDGHSFVIAIAVGTPADTKAAHDVHPEKVSIIR